MTLIFNRSPVITKLSRLMVSWSHVRGEILFCDKTQMLSLFVRKYASHKMDPNKLMQRKLFKATVKVIYDGRRRKNRDNRERTRSVNKI